MNKYLTYFSVFILVASASLDAQEQQKKPESKNEVTVKKKIRNLFGLKDDNQQLHKEKDVVKELPTSESGVDNAAVLPKNTSYQPIALGVADVVEPLMPAVVNVSGVREESIEREEQKLELPEGHPFGDLFKHFFEREMVPQPKKSTSLGSGFIISGDGYIVTNYHVIADADKVMISFDTAQDALKSRFKPEQEIEAVVVGVDPRTDIALLKINETDLPFVSFGDANIVRVGDPVIAIGNPFGLGGTVTSGIISSRARDIAGRSRNVSADFVPGYFQTDASINVGNSGGPMFNIRGEVIAVNTAILSNSGGNIGIGFAIPSDVVQDVIQQLKNKGRTSRGWLGILVQHVDADIAQTLELSEPHGALVGGINPKGPAADCGLKVGDVILRFNNQKITDSRFFPRIVGQAPINVKVPMVIWRNGKELTLPVSVGEYEKAQDDGFIPSTSAKAKKQDGVVVEELGLSVREITEAEAKKFEEEQGLLITFVSESSEAFAKGLRSGQMIKTANGSTMKSSEDLIEIVKKMKNKPEDKRSILILAGIKDQLRFVVLKLKDK